jgi:predicted deacetylase
MTDWTTTMHRALDSRATTVEMFFRDDDAGWADDRLFALLDVFAAYSCPIDLAAIPTAVGARLAGALLDRKRRGDAVGVHQHGFMHRDNEIAGRPCEFGPTRSAAVQSRDIREGQRALQALFGEHLDPIFTPPWNRCTEVTGQVLREHGIAMLSRDLTAGLLNIHRLAECPIHIDWLAKAKGRRIPFFDVSSVIARRMADTSTPIGIMLHHAEMGDDDFAACEALVRTVTSHPKARVVPMRSAVVMS